VHIQQDKEHFLTEKLDVKESVSRSLRSMIVLEEKVEEPVYNQVVQLADAIQQLQQRLIDLELRTMPKTSQDV
jgi:hypothetical protein